MTLVATLRPALRATTTISRTKHGDAITTTLLTPPARPWNPDDLTIVDAATRREFITMLGAAGLLVACGDDAGDSGASGGDAGFPRVIEHAGGTTTLDRVSQRVFVGTMRSPFDALLALGIQPVAVAGAPTESFGSWQRERGAEDLLRLDVLSLNVERLVPEDIDLVLASEFLAGTDAGGALRQLAPTIVMPNFSTPDDDLELLGKVFAREQDARRLIGERAELIESFEPVTDRTVTVFFAIPGEGSVFVYNPASTGGGGMAVLLEQLGITMTDRGRPQGEFGFELSAEQLGELDDELLLGVAPYPGDVGAMEETEQSALFRALPVVAEGRYVRLDTDASQAVLFGGTNLALPTALDALTRAFDR